MPSDAPLWIELTLAVDGARITVTPKGSDDSGPEKAQYLVSSFDDLDDLTRSVGKRAEPHDPLDAETLRKARDLFQDVFRDKVLSKTTTYVDRVRLADPAGRLLVRLAVTDPRLEAVAWEAMHARDGLLDTSDSITGSRRLNVVREVSRGASVKPLRILGSVRVMVLAAATTRVEKGIEAALTDAREQGMIEPLDVIPEAQVAKLPDLLEALQARSAPGKRPHILHIIGHGAVSRAPGAAEARPVLELPGGAGGPVTIPVQTLADNLQKLFGDELRLVVLDACEGAAPGPVGSAAEILARGAAVAVVAHLWPLDTKVAGAIARSFYTSLTKWHQARGDVAACLTSARSELEADGAGAFSPVLYLRGGDPVLFDFGARLGPVRRLDDPALARLHDPLKEILGESYSLILGDPGEDLADWYGALRSSIAEKLTPGSDSSALADPVQCYALVKGRKQLQRLFQDVVGKLLREHDRPMTPLTACLAEILPPGVHCTLLWTPILEQALAERHPDRSIYVVQPPLTEDHSAALWVMQRPAGEDQWLRPEDRTWRKELNLNKDHVVIRANGGYLLPEKEVRDTLFTDEDFAAIDWHAEMPPGWAKLTGALKDTPTLLVGVSILNWRHRAAVRGLFDHPLRSGSVSVLPRSAKEVEELVWTTRGGGLHERGGAEVKVVRLDPDELARFLLGAA
jgi:CHAT domain